MLFFYKKIIFYSFIVRIYYVNVMYSSSKRDTLIGKLMKSYSETLGPTFVKICQTLVYRNDLLPQKTLDELKPLLNKCMPEDNLENKIKNTFGNVSNIELIGSGTIAQVYSGCLEGKKYAFKVKRTEINKHIKKDISFLEEWFSFIHKYYPYCNILKRFDIIKKSIIIQTDFNKEIENCLIFEKVSQKLPNITVPHVYTDMSTEDIIVMDFIDGTPLCDTTTITDQNILKQILKLWLNGLLDYGLIHGDLHLGNLVKKHNSEDLVILDFGLVFNIQPTIQVKFMEYMNYFVNRDIQQITEWIFTNYILGEKTDKFKNDVKSLISKYITEEHIRFWDFSRELDILLLEHNLELSEQFIELEISKTTSFAIMQTLNNDTTMLLGIFDELGLI